MSLHKKPTASALILYLMVPLSTLLDSRYKKDSHDKRDPSVLRDDVFLHASTENRSSVSTSILWFHYHCGTLKCSSIHDAVEHPVCCNGRRKRAAYCRHPSLTRVNIPLWEIGFRQQHPLWGWFLPGSSTTTPFKTFPFPTDKCRALFLFRNMAIRNPPIASRHAKLIANQTFDVPKPRGLPSSRNVGTHCDDGHHDLPPYTTYYSSGRPWAAKSHLHHRTCNIENHSLAEIPSS